MSEPIFLKHSRGLSIREIAAVTGAEAPPGAAGERRVTDIATLERASPAQLTFLDHSRSRSVAAATHAAACLTSAALARGVKFRAGVAVLIVRAPYEAFVAAARALYPHARRPSSLYQGMDADGAHIDPSARLEEGVTVEPGVVIGPRAGIGAETIIAANAVIGAEVQIGRGCAIGAGATVANALIGDRVIIHPGCHIGQGSVGGGVDGGGLALPRVGRVIIQDQVEIGAGSAIDRGDIRDTVIGEGTKIDNLVRVGQNACIGRHCLVLVQTGISDNSIVEDHVVLGKRETSAAARCE